MFREEIDVFVVCALKDEFDQLLRVSSGLAEAWSETQTPDGRLVSKAVFEGFKGKTISVAATWLNFMGREQAQATITEISGHYKIGCLAMTGICAGRRGKVELGDVIFADRIYSYDSGKIISEQEAESFQPDPVQYHPPLPWVQCMQGLAIPSDEPWLSMRPALSLEYQENWVLGCLLKGRVPSADEDFGVECPDWPNVIQRLWKKGWVSHDLTLKEEGLSQIKRLTTIYPDGQPSISEFTIHVSPIATGAAVVEDEAIFDVLANSSRKVLGLDMEASGVAASAEALNIPVIVAKGVSDFADTYKDDRYRLFAARASAEALIRLVRNADYLVPGSRSSFKGGKDAYPGGRGERYTPRVDKELLDALSELYPDRGEIQSVWERSGGKLNEIDNINNPKNLWQGLLRKSKLGGSVELHTLLSVVAEDYPKNELLIERLRPAKK